MITMIIYNATPYNLLALGDQLFNRLQLVWRKILDDLIDHCRPRFYTRFKTLFIQRNIIENEPEEEEE